MKKSALAIVPAGPQVNRGRLVDKDWVARELYGHAVSSAWVLLNFAPEFRLRVGRKVLWRELDARDWLDAEATEQIERAAAK